MFHFVKLADASINLLPAVLFGCFEGRFLYFS